MHGFVRHSPRGFSPLRIVLAAAALVTLAAAPADLRASGTGAAGAEAEIAPAVSPPPPPRPMHVDGVWPASATIDATTITLDFGPPVIDADGVEERAGMFAFLDQMPAAWGGEQWRCLSEAIYFEARGETTLGQFAVGEVVLNRVDSPRFPGTVCGVVQQGSEKLNACQFSYECDGKPEKITEPKAFKRAGKIARLLMDGRPRTLTGEATFYHAASVRPKWTRKLQKTAEIDSHIFYRRPVRLSSN